MPEYDTCVRGKSRWIEVLARFLLFIVNNKIMHIHELSRKSIDQLNIVVNNKHVVNTHP